MIERCFRADLSALEEVTAFTEDTLSELDCPMKAVIQFNVAVEEIFVNIASYAYPEGDGEMTLSIDEDETCYRVVFTDSGVPFDPVAKEDPDVTLSVEERGIGGLGIYMVKKSMSSVVYSRENGKNILTITKNK